jgi:hypothetical protein
MTDDENDGYTTIYEATDEIIAMHRAVGIVLLIPACILLILIALVVFS